jgi:hypothetical protein
MTHEKGCNPNKSIEFNDTKNMVLIEFNDTNKLEVNPMKMNFHKRECLIQCRVNTM